VERGVNCLQVMGDSKLIIEWENGNYRFENLLIAHIMDRIKEARAQFEFISFQHVYRELSIKEDMLSKEALKMQEGKMKIEEEVEGCALPGITLSIYS
jgi:hypothetical protein